MAERFAAPISSPVRTCCARAERMRRAAALNARRSSSSCRTQMVDLVRMASASSAIQGSEEAASCRISVTVGHAAAILRASFPRSLFLKLSTSGLPLSKGHACARSRSEGWGSRSVTMRHSSWSEGNAVAACAASAPGGGNACGSPLLQEIDRHRFRIPAESAFCAARKSGVRPWAGPTEKSASPISAVWHALHPGIASSKDDFPDLGL
eukprot:11558210-Heterocapsa_arctica.AAC.1